MLGPVAHFLASHAGEKFRCVDAEVSGDNVRLRMAALALEDRFPPAGLWSLTCSISLMSL